jgi:hypothetical protein
LVARVRALRATAGLQGDTPTTVSADAGSCSHANAATAGDGIDLLIAAGRADLAARLAAAGMPFTNEAFGYDPAADAWVCPSGARLVRQVTPRGAPGRPANNRSHADPGACASCPLRLRCLRPGQAHRVLVVHRGRGAGALRLKFRQPGAQRRSARRKAIVAPVFGQLKEDRGFAGLSLRGFALARAEYLLACLAHNLGKLLSVCPLPTPAAA